MRQFVFGSIEGFADRLAMGDETALNQVEHLRAALVQSLEAGPIILDLLSRLRAQLEADLEEPDSYLSDLVDRELRAGILDLLHDPAHRVVVADAAMLGKENLDALDTDALVAQIEERVGADLQFIRLNGALVGGLIGICLALIHLAAG